MDVVTLRKHAGMLQALALLAKSMGDPMVHLDRDMALQVSRDLAATADLLDGRRPVCQNTMPGLDGGL